MIDNTDTPLNEVQRLKQALSIISGRLDVLNTRLQAIETDNHALHQAQRYSAASVRKSDEIFKHLQDGTTIKP